MRADENFNLTIDRSLFESRGRQILQGLCYIRKEHDCDRLTANKYIVEVRNIKINGIDIQGDAIKLSTRYIDVGFLHEEEEVVDFDDTGKETYKFIEIKKTAHIHEPKTIYFQQEIGTSKKWMGVYIYIKDSYSKIKEEIKEIRG